MSKVSVDRERFSPYIQTMSPAVVKGPKSTSSVHRSSNLPMIASCLNTVNRKKLSKVGRKNK